MRRTLGIMFTLTTYGTWLRGDARGWVDRGVVFPADPVLEEADRRRMKHSPFFFGRAHWLDLGTMIGQSLQERLKLRIWAMTVQSWHVHFVVAGTDEPVHRVVKCAKDAVRWGLRPDRPVWSDGYDKRFCFDIDSVYNRIGYVERHNLAVSLPRKPWPFIETLDFDRE